MAEIGLSHDNFKQEIQNKEMRFFFQLKNKNEQNTFHNDYYFSPSSCDNEFRERKITNKLVVVLALEGLSSEIFVLLLFFFCFVFNICIIRQCWNGEKNNKK